MRLVVFALTVLILVSCSSVSEPAAVPTSLPEQTAVTDTPVETQPTEPTLTPTQPPISPTSQPTEPPEQNDLPDLSAVTLIEATHLMDPKYFQVVLEYWPRDLPDDTLVLVDGAVFSCDELFPDQYPDRVYCWGDAPSRGEDVSVQVTAPGFSIPLLEIPFTVPSPGGG